MASLDPIPILTVLEQAHVSPPSATVANTTLPLTFFDIIHLVRPPLHYLFFYELPLTKTQFVETIVPNLKHSLSICLQYFFPFAGNLFVFPTTDRLPEIRYVENDVVSFTSAECNLDFNDLTGYHPRNCDKFHHLVPLLGDYGTLSSHIKIPLFSVQVTLFANCGFSIGISVHHSLGDAGAIFSFLKAWTSITRFGNDEAFLANGTLPIYERTFKYPNLEQSFLKMAKVETLFDKEYHPPKLPDSTNKVRATFVLTRTLIDSLKKLVMTQLPTVPYLSSFTVACAYIWCCLAKLRDDELQVFLIPMDCRTRMNPPIPSAYFGNCIWGSLSVAKTSLLTGKDGLTNAAKLMGENLHKTLNDEDGVVNDKVLKGDILPQGVPMTYMSISGTPKLKLYDVDFGWGKPKKFEKVSLDYSASISIDAGKECDQDMEIGVCLTNEQMEVFVRNFHLGQEPYI
ncbi:transferase, Chloramphenicol acetyltransferase-like domain protein [Artemisia annua]|uniref:Transferase, Chloramphenicol acetyltransferase-like domain protein n=1 Tax=Artemisia annua TaxID=35608 RepID=A0A2U1NBY5_ARTAN|nr:transferase, Chloramphenicol acetyltransferase-like domain protein [Artemisia annua]